MTWCGSFGLVCLSLLAACSAAPEPTSDDIDVAEAELTAANCPAGTTIIQGTSAANTINGTAARDCILGLGGNDTINGLGGDDFLIGGAGHDTIRGGDGNDKLFGETDNDTLYGEAGDDVIDTGTSANNLFLSPYTNSAWGGPGLDAIKGGPSVDNLYGDDGNDTIVGGGASTLLFASTEVIQGGAGIDQCSGTGCEWPAPTGTCVNDAQCTSGRRCATDIQVCAFTSCTAGDSDGDAFCDVGDGCPNDGTKIAPLVCGCGVSETNSDGDSAPNCIDACPNNAPKIAPGVCGCARADTDSDSDGTPNCIDGCVNDALKTAPGICGCGVVDSNSDQDSDGTIDCRDACPSDPNKQLTQGFCGCGVSEQNSDGDFLPDCIDECPQDANKLAPEICGCGVADVDSDGDTTLDCVDACPGHDDRTDMDGDGIAAGCDSDEVWACSAVSRGPEVWIGDYYFGGPSPELDGITCITGNLFVAHTWLEDLSGLEQLRGVGGSVTIDDNWQLATLDGLDALEEIGDGLMITNNLALHDLAALAALTELRDSVSFAATLWIENNPSLPRCWFWPIEANTGVTCGDGYPYVIGCHGNDEAADCGELPADFACVPGARAPGVIDGDLYVFSTNTWPELGGGLRCVTGNLWIEETTETNLTRFAALQQVGGVLAISRSETLTSVTGLESLTSVGGLSIYRNPLLTNLAGLANLRRAGTYTFIGDNARLPQCAAWSIASQTNSTCGYCTQNLGQNDCGELPPGFVCEPGAVGPGVYSGTLLFDSTHPFPFGLDGLRCASGGVRVSNSSLTDLTVLSGIPIAGSIEILDNPALVHLTGLEHVSALHRLRIWGNPQLVDLTGLDGLQRVEADLDVRSNASLHNVDGLDNLSHVGDLMTIHNNPTLTDLVGLSALTEIGTSAMWYCHGAFSIRDNASLPECWIDALEAQAQMACGYQFPCGGLLTPDQHADCTDNNGTGTCGDEPVEDIECVPGVTGPNVIDGDVIITEHWRSMPIEDLQGIRCVTGKLQISYTQTIADLSVLSALQKVAGSLFLTDNSGLHDVSALRGLTHIGGGLYIQNNPQLTSVEGFEDLAHVEHDVYVEDHASLASVDGFDSLAFIGRRLRIDNNPLLSNLSALSSLTSVGSGWWTPSDGVLLISNNASLPACWVSTLETQTQRSCGFQDASNPESCTNNGTGNCQ